MHASFKYNINCYKHCPEYYYDITSSNVVFLPYYKCIVTVWSVYIYTVDATTWIQALSLINILGIIHRTGVAQMMWSNVYVVYSSWIHERPSLYMNIQKKDFSFFLYCHSIKLAFASVILGAIFCIIVNETTVK